MKRIVLLILFALLMCSCSIDNDTPADTSNSSDIIAYDYAVLESNLNELNLYDEGNLLTGEEIANQLLLDVSILDEYFVYKHSDPLKSSICMIFLPSEGNEDKVKTDITSFMDMYKDTFDLYAPEEFALVEDYYTIDKGDYIIYTISEDNSAVINAINRSKK